MQAVCERVIIINKGKIIANERTEDLTRTIEDTYHYNVKICGPEKEVVASLEKIRGVKKVIPPVSVMRIPMRILSRAKEELMQESRFSPFAPRRRGLFLV